MFVLFVQQLPKDGGLLGFVFVLVLIDVLVMGLWFGLDTPQPRFNNIGTKVRSSRCFLSSLMTLCIFVPHLYRGCFE